MTSDDPTARSGCLWALLVLTRGELPRCPREHPGRTARLPVAANAAVLAVVAEVRGVGFQLPQLL